MRMARNDSRETIAPLSFFSLRSRNNNCFVLGTQQELHFERTACRRRFMNKTVTLWLQLIVFVTRGAKGDARVDAAHGRD